MQTQNPILDEIAKLTTAAMGMAQAAGDEAKAAFRSQTDRLVAEMDLVRREDHDALRAEVSALRQEIETLKAAAKPKKSGKAA
jgi:BMFP domain-containing protein YqiC